MSFESTDQNVTQGAALDRFHCRIEFSSDGHILDLNQKFLDLFGFSRAELIGRSIEMLLPQDARKELQSASFLNRSLQGGNQLGEFERIAQDGSTRWIQAIAMPILNQAGTIERVVEYSIDVTPVREARASVKEVNRQLDAQIMAIDRSNGRVEFNKDGVIIDVNEIFLQVFGYTRDEVIGQHHRTLVPPLESNSRDYQAFWERLRAGEYQTGEYLRIAKDGTHRLIQASYNPVYDAKGRILKVVELASDVTSKKKAQESARDAFSQYFAQLRAIDRSYGRIEFSTDGIIIDVNDNFLKIVGYDREELLGQHHDLITPSEHSRDGDCIRFWEPLTGGEYYSGEFKRISRDGSCRWIQATYNPVFSADGSVKKIVQYATDVTEKRRTAEQIRKLSAAVEQSPVAVSITDEKGVIEYVNSAYSNWFGRSSRATALGTVHPLFRETHQPSFNKLECSELEREGKVWREEFLCRIGNDEKWAAAQISPIQNSRDTTTHFLVLEEEITERKILMNRMQDLAFHDSLTGLPNRASILNSIQEAIDDSSNHRFALLYLDFDRFKLINDSLGHDVGDALLQEISKRLKGNLRNDRDSNIPARLGGDEFVVLLNDLSDWGDAEQVADRLLNVFSTSYRLGPHEVHATASIGIVTSESKYSQACDMLRDADLAMYEAKSAGKACYSIFTESMQKKIQKRLRIECELRSAIESHQFSIHYQPIISLETGRIEAVESLARWYHPSRGEISPVDFIPIAEETGLILPLGDWALQTACKQFRQWQEQLKVLAPRSIHVNVSRRQLLSSHFPDFVASVIQSNNLRPEVLHLEITESVIVGSPQQLVPAMKRLRALGVKLDIDDFGTGHSSLSCLHEFPIDALKIDRSFIDNLNHVNNYTVLLQTIVSLADNLDLQVVAEGIENELQLSILQSLGCSLGQGYLFSKALNSEDLVEFVLSDFEFEQKSAWSESRALADITS